MTQSPWVHDHPPLPSSDSALSSYTLSAYEFSLDAEENLQELSIVRRWLAVLCIPSASICVTCASSMMRRDGSLLDEGAELICCDMCIYGRHLGTSRGETILSEQGSCYPRRQPLRAGLWPRTSRCGPNVRNRRAQGRLSPLTSHNSAHV